MITTKSDEKIKLAQELYELREKRKEIDEREKKLKKYFEEEIGKENGMSAGNILILASPGKSSSLDKDGLIREIGQETYDKYLKITEYVSLRLVKAG